MAKKAKNEAILNEITPSQEVDNSGESQFKIKDEFFGLTKTFIDKKSKTVQEIDVDFRKICINNVHMVVFKDKALTIEQLSNFNDKAKAFWLEEIK